MLRHLAVALTITGALSVESADAAPTRINFCQAITAPGSYVLNQSLSGVWSQACIEIIADDVTLNLAGFEIDAGGVAGDGIRVRSGHKNVVIRNGSITGYVNGVLFLGKNRGGMIQGLRVHDNEGVGIAAQMAESLIITNNIAMDNAVGGIFFGPDSIVTGNIVANNGETLRGDCDSVVTGNVDVDNIGLPVNVTGGSGTCVVHDNASN